MLLLQLNSNLGILRTGRNLENRLRIAFLLKITRLPDSYFHSRLVSDMAERSHNLYQVRMLASIGGRLITNVAELVLTIVGLIWLDPSSAPIAIFLGLYGLSLPFLPQPLLLGSDLKVRTHNGALGRFYLDGLLGLTAIRTHRAERAVRREHESLLGEWKNASYQLQLLRSVSDGLQFTIIFGLIGWLVFDHFSHANSLGSIVLYVYWAASIILIAIAISPLARQYPTYRNITLRLLEPLSAPEKTRAKEMPCPEVGNEGENSGHGVSIVMKEVVVRAAGHTILENVNLQVAAGEHIAIVGVSGAGKSSLVGLLLGWHQVATGEIRINNQILDDSRLEELRRHTAWVDPAVQLWNRTLLQNLRYGSTEKTNLALAQLIEQADLRTILEKLPQGLQTTLGEGGVLVSGGEGQRVRLGRAMLRPDSELVILDEPFRGLDRQKRRQLLKGSRALWQTATLLCITHDVQETLSFDRVLVVTGGQIVEYGNPLELARDINSHYYQLLKTENEVQQQLWGGTNWRRWQVANGTLTESEDAPISLLVEQLLEQISVENKKGF